MKKRMNNKGFSLVELIVVMAIMAILAVTLAPRLMQYVEKSRKAADQEVVNSIYTTVQYALLDETLNTASQVAGLALSTTGLTLNSADAVDGVTEAYEVTAGTWTMNSTAALNTVANSPNDVTPYTYAANAFIQEIYNVVGNFKLKSHDAGVATRIVITATSGNAITVTLSYDGSGTADYTASTSTVR